jgi:hypothetical protein
MVRCYQVTTGDPVVNVAWWPHVVLRDSDELVAVYMPEGTKLWRWNADGRLTVSRGPPWVQTEAALLADSAGNRAATRCNPKGTRDRRLLRSVAAFRVWGKLLNF